MTAADMMSLVSWSDMDIPPSEISAFFMSHMFSKASACCLQTLVKGVRPLANTRPVPAGVKFHKMSSTSLVVARGD